MNKSKVRFFMINVGKLKNRIQFKSIFYSNSKGVHQNIMSAQKNTAETQGQQNILFRRIVTLSFKLEKIPIANIPQISAFFIIQTIFEVIFPSILLVMGSRSYMEPFRKIVNMLMAGSSSDESMLSNTAAAQIVLFIVLITVVTLLLFVRSQRIQQISLYFLTYFYCATTFILFLCASAIITFYGMSSESFIPMLGKFLSVANFLLGIVLCGFYKLIAQTYSSANSNQLCPRSDTQQLFISIARKIISVFMLTLSGVKMVWPEILPESQTIFIVCECLHFVGTLSRFKKQAQYFTYIHQKAANIYRGCLVIELSCIFSTLVCLISQEDLLNQNYVYSIGLIAMLLYLALWAYLGWRDQKLNLIFEEEIQDSEKAILFMMKLNHILQTDNIKTVGLTQMFMIKNIFKIHAQKCLAASCFCKEENLSRASIDQMGKVYRSMGFSLIEKLCEKFEGDVEVPKFILFAKLNAYNNFVGWPSLVKMSINRKRNDISFKEAFFLKKYCLELQEHIEKNSNYQNMATIQKCLECDRLYQYYLQKMLQVLEYRLEFWNRLTKNQITSQFDAKADAQLQKMIEIDEMNGFLVKNYLNLQLLTLIVGYEKNILLKQRITKEYISYIKRLSLIHQKNKLQMFKRYKIEEIMYQKLSCTIQASITQQQLGTVVSTSKNVINVFGYHPRDLVNRSIRKLIPNTMQDQHDEMLRNWVKTCSWERLGQLKNTFGMNKNNICFSCRFYLKPIIRQENVNLIAYFIKDNEDDYMLLSSNNVVVAAGRSFLNMLGPNIINLPISVLLENRVQFNKVLENPSSKNLHTFNFYSTKSKTNQEMHKLYKGFTISLERIKTCELPAALSLQLKQFHDETQCYSLKFGISETTMGKLRYRVIKLQNAMNKCENVNSTQKIFNQNGLQQQNISQADESNVFLNYDPSISSASSQGQSTSTYNLIERMEKMFYKKISIYDNRSLRLTVIIVILCVLGCGVDVGKIYLNELGFAEMEELLFLDNTYSYNIQLTMFIYNNVLTLDQQLKLYISNTMTSNKTQQVFLDQLKQQLQQSVREQTYLYDLIAGEVTDYNRMRTSLNDIHMYQFSNVVVLWKYLEEGQQEDVTILMFITNFLYFSEKVQGVIGEIMDMLNVDAADAVQDSLLEGLVKELSKSLLILNKNFHTLEQLSTMNLDYHSNLLKQSKSTLTLFCYVKMACLIAIFFVILYYLNYHYDFRAQQKHKIYSDYRYITVQYALGVQEYLQKISKLLKGAVLANDRENTNSDVDREEKVDMNVGLMAKINKINEEMLLNQAQQNYNKVSAGLKLTVEKQGSLNLKLCYIVLFFAIIGLNLLMKSAQQKIITKSEEIVAFINHLITSQNKLMTTYFQYKAQPLTGITLTNQQLATLLQKVKMIQVQFTEVAVDSIQLFAAYDDTYVDTMTFILTESICTLRKNQLEPDDYDRCVNMEEMKIIKFGVVNGMNAFSRKMENLIEEQMKSQDKSEIQTYSMTEIDLTLYSMFKVYQKIQAQIADSLSVAANHQKTEFLIEMAVELLVLVIFLCFVLRFYRKDKRDTLFRIGRILLLPIGIIKTNAKIFKNFQKAIDFTNIKED